MTAAGLSVLNYMGPLRKYKNAPTDDDPTVDVSPFEFERFKRHLSGLLERVSRIATNGESRGNDTDDTLREEDDTNETAEHSKAIKEEESDWVFDVKQTMDVLPRLQSSAGNN